jgi:hypothetical protein
MKVVLAIEHGVIPPTIGLTNPNPESKSYPTAGILLRFAGLIGSKSISMVPTLRW